MKKNILFLIESLSGGGAEKVLTTLLQHIDKAKFNITLCCIVNQGVYIKELPDSITYTYLLDSPEHLSGFKRILYKIKYQLIYKLLPLSWVYQWFLPHHADVEVAFVEGFATKLLSHSTNKKAKKIAWVHTDLINNHWIESIYQSKEKELKSYQTYDKIIGISQTACNAIQKLYHLSERTQLLYNPINSQQIKQLAQLPLQRGKDHKQGCFRMVSVGRFVHQKAFDRLVSITNKLIKSNYQIELWILGVGPQKEQIENYICSQQIEDHVTLWGFQTNPYAYMSLCDLFVCSSISEGYSTAVTEALILGLPVITTDCSGMDELLDHGTYGIITENSEEALYEGLKQLLDNPTQLAYYKKQAEKRSEDFSIEKLMKPIETLLLQ